MNDHQPNILERCNGAHCARMLGYHFSGKREAREWLDVVAKLPYQEPDGSGIWVSVALSYAGLQLLASATDLVDVPEAFRAGMARRAARLCDPEWPADDEARQRGQTHALLLVLARPGEPDDADSHALRSVLSDCGRAAQAGEGIGEHGPRLNAALESRLSAVCATLPKALPKCSWSHDLHHPLTPIRDGDGWRYPVVEYFGFRDGIGQPRVETELEQATILIKSRSPLLSGGTFLVVRQLEQNPRSFWEEMRRARGDDASQLAELLVGRRQDGSALERQRSTLGEEYESDAPAFSRKPGETSPACPFQSHARRMNPQLGADPHGAANPRLLRRGMSYYDKKGRVGMMFMAYNADIEAQFEFIQANWIARGSQAGGLSSHRDPIASSSRPDLPASTTFVAATGDDSAISVALPSFVELRWGEYFFVPSRRGLTILQSRDAGDAEDAEPIELADALRCLNDPHAAHAFWTDRVPPAGLKIGNHVFVKRIADLKTVLCEQRPSSGFSVCEYGRRGRSMVGPIMLTIDSDTLEYAQAAHARRLIPSGYDELVPIMETAQRAATAFLKGAFLRGSLRNLGRPSAKVAFRSDALIASVLAEVWAAWGIPGPGSGSLATWGRQITEPIARLGVDTIRTAQGRQAGKDLQHYLLDLVSAARNEPASRSPLAKLLEYFDAIHANDDDTVRALSGIVVGSASTTAGTFILGLARYARRAGGPDITGLPTEAETAQGDRDTLPASRWPLYDDVLAQSLEESQAGAPDYLYRTYQGDPWTPFPGGPVLERGDRVVVWLGGAAAAEPDLRFGAGPHRCPGKEMAKAIIEGTLQALKAVQALERLDEDGVNFALRMELQ